jgi:hypothetical protein
MKFKSLLLAVTCTLVASSALAEQGNACPADLVKFWTTVANQSLDPDAVPRFLVDNHCVEVFGKATKFHDLTAQRLDQPESEEVLNDMMAQLNLNWANNPDLKR